MVELTKKAMELLQEQKGVLEYSNELNALWSEIDFYRPLPTDPKGRDYILKGRTYRFLTGLRPEFETIRTLLLHREHPLTFDESVVQVIQEESGVKAMQTQFSLNNQAFCLKIPLYLLLQHLDKHLDRVDKYLIGDIHMDPHLNNHSHSPTIQGSHIRKEKVMLKIPYGVISASDIDIPETRVGRYMGVLQQVKVML